jgi:hypothetical protein
MLIPFIHLAVFVDMSPPLALDEPGDIAPGKNDTAESDCGSPVKRELPTPDRGMAVISDLTMPEFIPSHRRRPAITTAAES